MIEAAGRTAYLSFDKQTDRPIIQGRRGKEVRVFRAEAYPGLERVIMECKKLCKIILKHKKQWSFEITARIDHFDTELIMLLKKAGCHTIAVGIESGNENLRKKMNKN